MNRQRTVLLAVAAAVTLTAVGGALAITGNDVTNPPASNTDETTPAGTEGTTPGEADGATGDDESAAPDESEATGPFRNVTSEKRVRLKAAPEQVLRGQTTLEQGATLDVRVVTPNGTANPFIRSAEATVAADGTFRTTVDLASVPAGTTFEVTVRHEGSEIAATTGVVIEAPAAGQDQSDASDVPRFHVDDERLTLEAGPNQTVTGTTDLDAGTTVSIRVRSGANGQPFIRTTETTIGEDGRFQATFNLSSITTETSFEASLHHDGETLTTSQGTVEA